MSKTYSFLSEAFSSTKLFNHVQSLARLIPRFIREPDGQYSNEDTKATIFIRAALEAFVETGYKTQIEITEFFKNKSSSVPEFFMWATATGLTKKTNTKFDIYASPYEESYFGTAFFEKSHRFGVDHTLMPSDQIAFSINPVLWVESTGSAPIRHGFARFELSSGDRVDVPVFKAFTTITSTNLTDIVLDYLPGSITRLVGVFSNKRLVYASAGTPITGKVSYPGQETVWGEYNGYDTSLVSSTVEQISQRKFKIKIESIDQPTSSVITLSGSIVAYSVGQSWMVIQQNLYTTTPTQVQFEGGNVLFSLEPVVMSSARYKDPSPGTENLLIATKPIIVVSDTKHVGLSAGVAITDSTTIAPYSWESQPKPVLPNIPGVLPVIDH